MDNQATLVKHIDPRLNLTAEKQFSTSQGASYISTAVYRPNGSTIGTATNFSCNPPNRNIVVSREVIKLAEFKITITGTSQTALAQNIFEPFAVAPSYMPLSRVTLNESMKIGNDTITGQNTDIVREALCRYDCDKYYTGTASMNDTYQTFESVDLSNRSALAPYGDNTGGQYGDVVSRRAYWTFDDNVSLSQQSAPVIGTANTVVLTFAIEEPLMLSPFVFGEDARNAEGLYGVESAQYSCQFGNLLKAFNYVADKINLDNIVVKSEITEFGLRFKYLTPQLNQPIPRNALYSYYEPQVRTAQRIAVASDGLPTPAQVINLQLSGIPRRVYMLMRDTDTTGTKPLRYLALAPNSLSVRINGQSSLQGQSNIQLYDTCKRNGLNLAYSQWSKYTGSVMCVDFGKGDIALHPEQAPAVSQKNEFEFSASYLNKSGESIDAEFTIVVVYDGVFRMEDGNTSHSINPISEQSILSTATNTSLLMDNSPDNVYGGNINWSGLGKTGLKIAKCVVDNLPAPKSRSMRGRGIENVNGGRMVSRSSLRSRY
tara:strand:+ start:2649 stop:4280 length:1632 start_codon:yes stop_codon:yes gene_type:complete